MSQAVVVTLASDAALFSNPDSEEAQLQNLALNMLGGLEYEQLSADEKALLKKHGYDPEGDA